MIFFSDALSSCLYISVSLKNDLLKQHESLNGTYIWKKVGGQPTWKSLKLHGESSTNLDTNVIWKKSNNSIINGDWMIGKMGETKKRISEEVVALSGRIDVICGVILKELQLLKYSGPPLIRERGLGCFSRFYWRFLAQN